MAEKCTGNCFKCANRENYNEQDELLCPLFVLIKRTNDLKEKHLEITNNQIQIIEMIGGLNEALKKEPKQKTSILTESLDESLDEIIE